MYIGIVRLPTNAKFESCYACAILIEKALILSKTYIYIYIYYVKIFIQLL